MHLHSSIIDDKDGNTQVGLVSDDPVAVKLLNRYDLSIICAWKGAQCTMTHLILMMINEQIYIFFPVYLFIQWFGKRSKRKASEQNRRKRIRPCLKICQTVEERCPYLLPGDRAPGYNTQYAGEPTFLCNGNKFIQQNIVNWSLEAFLKQFNSTLISSNVIETFCYRSEYSWNWWTIG